MLRSSGPVVVIAFSVELRRALRETRRRVGHNRHELHRLAAGLTRSCLGRITQALHARVVGNRAHPLATCFSQIEGADRGDHLHTQFGLRVAERVATTGADAQRANSLTIDLGMLDEVVDRAADVVKTLRGNLDQPRLAPALPLVRGVVSERDESLLREPLGVEARRLLLHPAERVGHDDRCIPTVRGEACRLEEVADDGRPHVPGRGK